MSNKLLYDNQFKLVIALAISLSIDQYPGHGTMKSVTTLYSSWNLDRDATEKFASRCVQIVLVGQGCSNRAEARYQLFTPKQVQLPLSIPVMN
jgi:hypothetical protein